MLAGPHSTGLHHIQLVLHTELTLNLQVPCSCATLAVFGTNW